MRVRLVRQKVTFFKLTVSLSLLDSRDFIRQEVRLAVELQHLFLFFLGSLCIFFLRRPSQP